RASRSSTSKKPGCFIIHSSTQSPQEVWNHRYALKTMEFLEPSILGRAVAMAENSMTGGEEPLSPPFNPSRKSQLHFFS
ncbi:hypothetical protein, partial [Gluconobacter japonicus]|uniref:hypothetical protein n=1 Tax=Gluconobacter japonicus TaxID=376620 RepID=UPI0024E0E73D